MTQHPTPINGDRMLVGVDRARGELRHGRAVLLRDGDLDALAASVEAVTPTVAASMRRVSGDRVGLAVRARRAEALGVVCGSTSCALLPVHDAGDAALVRAIAWGRTDALPPDALDRIRAGATVWSEGSLPAGAIELARQARLSPAMLVCQPESRTSADVEAALTVGDVLALDVADIPGASELRIDLQEVSRARVPLVGTPEATFRVFREANSDEEHVAVIVGEIPRSGPVHVRVHSSCFTGDLFGSLRCDCGEQLQAAVAYLADRGGGVILYMQQEGRGIGLGNKLRAYNLQDLGHDTYDANGQLGFDPDERRFDVAAAILRALAIDEVVLLTNNPRKIELLTAEGVRVAGRVALAGGLTRFNERYLRSKVQKGGHFEEAVAGDGTDIPF